MPTRSSLFLLALASASLSAGCRDDGIFDGRVCTEIGCASGLTVEFEAAATAPFQIEVVSAGTGARAQQACADPARCGLGAFFEDVTADAVVLTVTNAAGTRRYELRPTYVERRPNGPRCDPLCRTAVVRVRLPG